MDVGPAPERPAYPPVAAEKPHEWGRTLLFMHSELFTIPVLGLSLKSYGLMLCLGFLSGVWLAMRRAERVRANPDTVLDLSFLCLLFGVGGARIFYVAHYWESQFAMAPNKFLAVINITQGGLEFLGGFLGAWIAVIVYALWKKVSLRLYLDILAPSCMWGLAITRLGCFLNGCCFGGICADPGHESLYPWAVKFPYGSLAFVRQWEDRQVTVPAELIITAGADLRPTLVPAALLTMSVEKREGPRRLSERTIKEARKVLAEGGVERAGRPPPAELSAAAKAARERLRAHERELLPLTLAQRFPSRVAPGRDTSVSELQRLAGHYRTVPVHPAQLYATVNALLLSGLLAAVFRYRKRHGVVMAALLLLYPIPRILLERIRADNPHDVAGLTISQFVSVALFSAGLIYLIALYRWLPERSPAVALEAARREREEADSPGDTTA